MSEKIDGSVGELNLDERIELDGWEGHNPFLYRVLMSIWSVVRCSFMKIGLRVYSRRIFTV